MVSERFDGKGKTAEVISLDQRQLLPRHANGDPEAFKEFVTLYRAPVYTYLTRCGLDRATSDDLFQEVFVKIHFAAATYRPQHALTPWVFTIVANTVRSHFRKKEVKRLVYEVSEKREEKEAPSAHDIAEANETAGWLAQAIKKLPLHEREVIVLHSLGTMDQKEVAKTLDIPVNTVKTHLRRGRMALAEALCQRKAKQNEEVSK